MKLSNVSMKATHIKAPSRDYKVADASIFLAGSIEMGKAEEWQTKVFNALKSASVTVFNPRRDDWDNSWGQTISDERFMEQVSWEHEHILKANTVFFYFDPETKSPISLLELGLVASRHRNGDAEVIVVCPDGFWRKGNVEFICKEYDMQLFNTLEAGIQHVVQSIK